MPAILIAVESTRRCDSIVVERRDPQIGRIGINAAVVVQPLVK
jgi:hypothetical protein